MKAAIHKKITIPSINYHLWRPCNMKCKFCFATFNDSIEFLPKGHLTKEDSLRLIDEIIVNKFEKITFAGGEPTLCKWLPELIEKAKKAGMTTMIVTNGTFLTDSYLDRLKTSLDWITLSIDSLDDTTNKKSGRFTRKITPNATYYLDLIDKIKSRGIQLKINTVVSKLNYEERMDDFIIEANPRRWKIFQVLPIKGENDTFIDELKITKTEFNYFLTNHESVEVFGIPFIPENNDDMTASYVMIDPAGRFYDNASGKLTYSDEILKVGFHEAYSQVNVAHEKFVQRNGMYDWSA